MTTLTPTTDDPRAVNHADQTLQHVYQYMAYLLQLDGATITESMSAVRKFAPKLATLQDDLAAFFAAHEDGQHE